VEDNKKCCEEGLICVTVGICGSIILFFILLFVFAKWGPAINFSTTTQTKGEPFVVQGTGKSFVAPDIAKIDLGIEESGTDLKTVQDSVNKKSQSLVSQVEKLGIAAAIFKRFPMRSTHNMTTRPGSNNNRLSGFNKLRSYRPRFLPR